MEQHVGKVRRGISLCLFGIINDLLSVKCTSANTAGLVVILVLKASGWLIQIFCQKTAKLRYCAKFYVIEFLLIKAQIIASTVTDNAYPGVESMPNCPG